MAMAHITQASQTLTLSDADGSYFSSTLDLRQGSVVCEISLVHLPCELVSEFLRLRSIWPSSGAPQTAWA